MLKIILPTSILLFSVKKKMYSPLNTGGDFYKLVEIIIMLYYTHTHTQYDKSIIKHWQIGHFPFSAL